MGQQSNKHLWKILIALCCMGLFMGACTSQDKEVPTLAVLPTMEPSPTELKPLATEIPSTKISSNQEEQESSSAEIPKTSTPIPTTQDITQPPPEEVSNDDTPFTPEPLAAVLISETIAKPVPQQVVIQFEASTSQQEREAYVKSVGGEIVSSIDSLDTVVVRVPETTVLKALPQSDMVVSDEPDYYASALLDISTPTSDPYYDQQWALPVIGAPEAWQELPDDAPKVTVAVIDSGVCLDHLDLEGRILDNGYDFVDDDNIPQDKLGHGCGVAGIIAANIDNGIGIAGVAPNAQIMPVRVLDAQGIGTYSDVAAGIVYSVDNGAEIINLSLGGAYPSTVLEDAVNYAVGHKVKIVAAAGNTGEDQPLYPARYDGVVSVGALDQNGEITNFSNRGADVYAPGVNVLTISSSDDYVVMSGTSLATAFIITDIDSKVNQSGNLVLNDSNSLLSDDNEISTTPAISAQGVIDDDQRQRITTTDQQPWSAIVLVHLEPSNGGTPGECSGTLIDSRYVLTAAHCLIFKNNNGDIIYGNPERVLAGVDGNIEPYGERFVSNTYIPSEWTGDYNDANIRYDYAVLKLSSPFPEEAGTFDLAIFRDEYLEQNTFNVTGYPHDKCYLGTPNCAMWQDSGSVWASQDYLLKYKIDMEGGQSGGPVWIENNGYKLAGINSGDSCEIDEESGVKTCTSNDENGARRITNDLLEDLDAWNIPYTIDLTAPSGAWSSPINNISVGTNVYLSGNVTDDDIGVAEVRFTAYWNEWPDPDNWYIITYENIPQTGNTYTYNWYLCQPAYYGFTPIDIPVGATIQLGMDIMDNAGNISYSPNGLRTVTKGNDCENTGGGGDTIPPTGSWLNPPNGQTVTSSDIFLSTSASDSGGSGLREVRYSAKWAGDWHGVGVATSYPYQILWDMCESSVPDGDIELGMEVWDHAGNKWVYSEHFTNIHINKSHNCDPPPPADGVYLYRNTGSSGTHCHVTQDTPDIEGYCSSNGYGSGWNDSVQSIEAYGEFHFVVFKDNDYHGPFTSATGDLPTNWQAPGGEQINWRTEVSSIRVRRRSPARFTIYDMGDYGGAKLQSDRTIENLEQWNFDNTDNTANDAVESIQVASGYEVIVCEHAGFHGLCGRTSSQAGDLNSVASGLRHQASSVRLCEGSCPPAPYSPILESPGDGEMFVPNSQINFQWTGNAKAYQVEYWGGDLQNPVSTGWFSGTQWSPGILPQSDNPYYWKVRGWNDYGEGGWSVNSFSVGSLPADEISALVALYNSTNGENWTENDGWLATNNPCDWYGVTCESGRVIRLYLAWNNLVGTVPSDIGNLSSLEHLYLQHNQLTGTIPSSLGSLTNLISLDISFNQLIGSIPSELGDLKDLGWLSLENNLLSGNIPSEIGSLLWLEVLYLNDNQLTGNIPLSLGGLNSLTSLNFNNNQINGTIPSTLGSLTNLNGLSLGYNQLTGSIPPELGDLTLNSLLLNNNQLQGEIPSSITNLGELFYLDLGYNCLISSNSDVLEFLSNHDPDWQSTQCSNTPMYTYTNFESDNVDMYVVEGQNVALLVPSLDYSLPTLTDMVSVFDDAYDYYAQITGREPTPYNTYNGLDTMAVVPSTCGAGCAYLGFTGIEYLQSFFDNVIYPGVFNNQEYDHVPFFELGRNFWFYGDQIEYKGADDTGSVTTGFAVFMRFMAMDAVAVVPGPFDGTDFAVFRSEVEGLLQTYLADPTLNWDNTLRIGVAPTNSLGLGSTDLFASFMFELQNLYGDAFVETIWKEVENRPTATSTQMAVDNFIVAASISAGENLKPLFVDEWRWPISTNAIEELNSLFGTTPSNDEFDTPTNINSLPFTDGINTGFATTADDDPSYSYDCSDFGNTVWYSFTPTSDIVVNVNTFGSDFDTVLSIWSGSRGNLKEHACNDDSDPELQSQFDVALYAGTTYYIMVGGYDSESGNLSLDVDVASTGAISGYVTDSVGVPLSNIHVVTGNGGTACTDVDGYYVLMGLIPGVNYGVDAGGENNPCDASVNYFMESATAYLTNPGQVVSNIDFVLERVAILDTPVVISPICDSITEDDQPTFKWQSVSDATMYDIQLDTLNPPEATFNATTTQFKPASPLFPTTYYWRVRAGNYAGQLSEWSPICSLDITSPTNAAPSQHYVTTNTPTLSWNRVTGATEYEVEVSTDSKFTQPISFSATVSADTLYVISTALDNGTYYWRVRAKDDTAVGSWSPVQSFIVNAP